MATTRKRQDRKPAKRSSDRRAVEERERKLDEALRDTFPGSDPVAALEPVPPADEQPSRRRK